MVGGSFAIAASRLACYQRQHAYADRARSLQTMNVRLPARRHDMDALRAAAMLLGIAYHVSLSFALGFPWMVQDRSQNQASYLFQAAVHGFRMPLFFLISGFFTAMLWRKQGLKFLLWHRFRRILLPCLLSLITVVPAIDWAVASANKSGATKLSEAALVEPAVANPVAAVENVEPAGVQRNGGNEAASQQSRNVLHWLIHKPVFTLVWFLWFLWWLVVVFAMYASVADRLGWKARPHPLIPSPASLLWLLPLTMLSQCFMGSASDSNWEFGPDTSLGIVPMPHVFAYYALFFGFGVLYCDCDDVAGRVGQSWRWTLPVSLLIVFPLGLEFATGTFGLRDSLLPARFHRPATVAFQALYAWMMTFGGIGMFRSLLMRENRTIRYISDSSYWLYLAHLPLTIIAQIVVRDWPLPAIVKLTLIGVALTGFLLLTYDKLVRYTCLGTLLNGPRKRPEKHPP